MTTDEAKMSKYARKKAKQAKAREEADAAFTAIALAMQITNGKAKPTPLPAELVRNVPPKKSTPPPQPRWTINPLGDGPERLAHILDCAAEMVRQARELADDILEVCGPGIQKQDPLAIAQFASAILMRIQGMADRARRIKNKKA